ncbi:MAG TPA: hypothetical protein DDW50_04845 [Firmicutes bacterium]|jgi:uncharacterized RDD family membrane protein YckC|nr:hypothetical protein [Bacillota bacterium]
MNDAVNIVTPENIELNYEIAGIGSRFLAIAIDTVIQWVLILGIFSSLSMLKLSSLQSKITNWRYSLAGALLVGLILVILIGYYIILETVMNGQTLGKKLVNIRVRHEAGYALSFWNVLLRNVIRMIDFLPFCYGIGVFTMFFNKKAKRLGDYAAGTIVIKELSRRKIKDFLEQQSAVIVVPFEQSMRIREQYPMLSTILLRMTQADYLLLKDLYQRRKELTNIQRLSKALLLRVAGDIEGFKLVNENDALAVLTELLSLYENQ